MRRFAFFGILFFVALLAGRLLIYSPGGPGHTAQSKIQAPTKDENSETNLPPEKAPLNVDAEKQKSVAKLPFCPVDKPQSIPEGLERLFSRHPYLTPAGKLDDLEALAQEPATKEKAEALRWFIHQGAESEVARNEAIKVLLEWSPEWLEGDIARMMTDQAQSEEWRVYCVQFLQVMHERTQSDSTLSPIWDAVTGQDAPVRDQALFSMADLGRSMAWEVKAPTRHARLCEALDRCLQEKSPATLVSALRSAALLPYPAAAPRAEALAADRSVELQVRVAAVQALGQIGRPESAASLKLCADSNKKILSRFAKMALTNLSSPQQQ